MTFKTLLEAYLPFTETVDVRVGAFEDLPICDDPDDQKFLRLAVIGRAKVLVSGDRGILKLAQRAPFAIESPARFRSRFA